MHFIDLFEITNMYGDRCWIVSGELVSFLQPEPHLLVFTGLCSFNVRQGLSQSTWNSMFYSLKEIGGLHQLLVQ